MHLTSSPQTLLDSGNLEQETKKVLNHTTLQFCHLEPAGQAAITLSSVHVDSFVQLFLILGT